MLTYTYTFYMHKYFAWYLNACYNKYIRHPSPSSPPKKKGTAPHPSGPSWAVCGNRCKMLGLASGRKMECVENPLIWSISEQHTVGSLLAYVGKWFIG